MYSLSGQDDAKIHNDIFFTFCKPHKKSRPFCCWSFFLRQPVVRHEGPQRQVDGAADPLRVARRHARGAPEEARPVAPTAVLRAVVGLRPVVQGDEVGVAVAGRGQPPREEGVRPRAAARRGVVVAVSEFPLGTT